MTNTYQNIILKIIVVIVLICTSLISIGEILTKSKNVQWGGLDFHSYWYSGHFMRQKSDPFQAYLQGKEIASPISYFDTNEIPEEIAQIGFPKTPANTAPYVIILSLFSFLSWPTAKFSWIFFNLVLLLIIPWILILLLPKHIKFSFYYKLLIALSFYSLNASRVAVWVGQTTLITFALMIGTLLTMQKHKWISGILLGFALSKYSISLPVFLIVLFNKRYFIIGMSLFIQLLGVLFITLLSGSSPIIQVIQYFKIMQYHANLPSIHLSYLFSSPLNILVSISLILVTFGFLLYWYHQSSVRCTHTNLLLIQFHIFSILVLWTLLIAYHRMYDISLTITFITLLIYGLRTKIWSLSKSQRRFVLFIVYYSIILLCLPTTFLAQLLNIPTDFWILVLNRIMTLTLLIMLLTSIFLLFRLTPNMQLD